MHIDTSPANATIITTAAEPEAAEPPLHGLARLMAEESAPRSAVDYPVDPWAHLYGVVPTPGESREDLKVRVTEALYRWMAELGLGPLAKR